MSRVTPDIVLFTPESCHEAVILRAYCEAKFPVGEPNLKWESVTGEKYTEITVRPIREKKFIGPEEARIAAQQAFDEYAKDKSGTLYWRVLPEIALGTRQQGYCYYMRLLISDKPRKDSN